MDHSHVLLIGRITKDVELEMKKNKEVVNMTVATNRWTTRGTRRQQVASFIPVTAWGRTAIACAEFLEKASRVMVVGTLEQSHWVHVNKKTGRKSKHNRLYVNASKVIFLDEVEVEYEDEDDEILEQIQRQET